MKDDIKELEATWDRLAKVFNNWAGIRPRKSWFKTGLTERAGFRRVRILEDGKEAAKFFDLTKDCTERELRYLLKRAEINFEQAHAASRVNTVLNGTVLIGFIVLFNQIFPGLIAETIKRLFQVSFGFDLAVSLAIMLSGLLMIIIILSYSHGGTAQARDLKHLLELSLARREFHGGKRHNKDGMTEPPDVLRESFITDI